MHFLYALSGHLASAIDRLIGDHGMALLFHHDRPQGRLDAWHDEQGAFTLEVWRFEFIRDKGMPWLRRA